MPVLRRKGHRTAFANSIFFITFIVVFCSVTVLLFTYKTIYSVFENNDIIMETSDADPRCKQHSCEFNEETSPPVGDDNSFIPTKVMQSKASQKLLNLCVSNINSSEKNENEATKSGPMDSSITFSEDDENEICSNICTELCCRPEALSSIPEQSVDENIFIFSPNDEINVILEKHDTYLIALKKSDKRLKPIEPVILISHPCSCGKRCDALLSNAEICQYRISWAINYHDRSASQFFFIKMLIHNKTFLPRMKSHAVCIQYFANVNIIPMQRIERFINLINAGVCQPIHPNSGKHFEHQSTVDKLVKLAIFLDDNFDSDPTQNAFMATSKWDKSSAAGEALNIPPNKRRNYNFKKLFQKLTVKTIFQSGNDLTKCTVCTEDSFQLHRIDLPEAERAKLTKEWNDHKERMRKDRRDYTFRNTLSQEQPTKYLSAIHDGMSKNKLRLPKLNDHRSKKVDDNDRIFCSLNLVLIHRKDANRMTKSIGLFSPGACYNNKTDSIVSQLLYAISTCSIIPPTVFFQVDNFSANKSYIFFAILGYLLTRQKAIREVIFIKNHNERAKINGYFFQFYISYMMPGHTHCDVDAKFGNFSTFLNKKECGSPKELMNAFVDAIHGEAEMFQTIYNFNDLLHPYCENYGKEKSLKSMYDFHIFLEENRIPMIENARFKLSDTFLCGERQEADSFVSKLFTTMPPSNINFKILPPKLQTLEKLPQLVPKWEKVISEEAKIDLLSLKTSIESHKGTPFKTLLKTIDSKAVNIASFEQQGPSQLQTNEAYTTQNDSVAESGASGKTTITQPQQTPTGNIGNRRSARLKLPYTNSQKTIMGRKRKAT